MIGKIHPARVHPVRYNQLMIRWVDVGQQASGVFALGQEATGVIAIGQLATGVIAIGQVARGVVAVGQGAVGLVAIGQGAVGVFWALAMLGVGGRGFGIVLPTVPKLAERVDIPQEGSWKQIEKGNGWRKVEVLSDDAGGFLLKEGGRKLDVRVDVRLKDALEDSIRKVELGSTRLVFFRGYLEGPVAEGVMEVPVPRWKSPGWWSLWALQLVAMVASCVFFWMIVGIPLVQALFNPGGILNPQ
jgi:hypothetical protein